MNIPIMQVPALEGRISVFYVVNFQGADVETVEASGRDLPEALNALAEKLRETGGR